MEKKQDIRMLNWKNSAPLLWKSWSWLNAIMNC